MKKVIYLLVVALIIMYGCGPYSFSPSGKSAFQSIHISQFENQTIQYELADRLTDAVIEAFIQDNTVNVGEASNSEALMTGSVTSYRREAHTFDQADIVTEYVIKVSIHVKVVKSNTEDVIWEENFYTEGVFDANDETEEEEGQNRVIDKLKADILDKITKSW